MRLPTLALLLALLAGCATLVSDVLDARYGTAEMGANDHAAQLVARETDVLQMPAAEGSNASLLAWRAIAAAEDRLLTAKTHHMNRVFGAGQPPINLPSLKPFVPWAAP